MGTTDSRMMSLDAIFREIEGEHTGILTRIENASLTDLGSLTTPQFHLGDTPPNPIAIGEGISYGAMSGKLFKDYGVARKHVRSGGTVILYFDDLAAVSTERYKEIRNLGSRVGIITRRVSWGSHAAILLGKQGIPIVRIDGLIHNGLTKAFSINGTKIDSEEISIDGRTGKVYAGTFTILPPVLGSEVKPTEPDNVANYREILSAGDIILSSAGVRVMVNADDISSIEAARKWGVNDVSLVRTERVMSENRVRSSFAWYLNEITKEPRIDTASFEARTDFVTELKDYLRKLFEIQKNHFLQIRLLDAPLHEIISADDFNKSFRVNPALEELIEEKRSPRGADYVRWKPEIYDAQIEAIFSAAKAANYGSDPIRISIPFVRDIDQVRQVDQILRLTKAREEYKSLNYVLAVTIETAPVCHPEVLSKLVTELNVLDFAFGTNDLIPSLNSSGNRDSFQTCYVMVGPEPRLVEGVIYYIRDAISAIRLAGKNLSLNTNIGICGEINDFNFSRENLGQFVTRANYFAVGRNPPMTKLLLAKTLIQEYRKNKQ